MDLTAENVQQLLGPDFDVLSTERGVQIKAVEYEDVPAIGPLIQAALTLRLDPSQICDDSTYEYGTDWGGMTGKESDRIYLDVTFLWASA